MDLRRKHFGQRAAGGFFPCWLAVISFHSLEDRIVKQYMNRLAKAPPANRRLPEAVAFVPPLALIGGAIKATDEELAANPRARSAVLRVAQKREAAA